MRLCVFPHDLQDDDEEGDEEGGNEEGDGLGVCVSGGWGRVIGRRTSVAQSKLTNTTRARQFCCSGFSIVGTARSTAKTTITATSTQNVPERRNFGHCVLPSGVRTSLNEPSCSSPCKRAFLGSFACPNIVFRMPRFAACALRSMPIISRQTVLRSHTTCSRRCRRSSCRALSTSSLVTIAAYAFSMRVRFSDR